MLKVMDGGPLRVIICDHPFIYIYDEILSHISTLNYF